MTDGLMLPPGAGRSIAGAGMTLKVGADQSSAWSAFEALVTPGFDVGAHLHRQAEEFSAMFVPAGCPHAFANPAPPRRACCSWSPRQATSTTWTSSPR
jgi:hypothetical protein